MAAALQGSQSDRQQPVSELRASLAAFQLCSFVCDCSRKINMIMMMTDTRPMFYDQYGHGQQNNFA